MGIFDYWKKDRTKPEVTGVPPPRPAPPAPRAQADGDSSPSDAASTYTYLVVKGDSLSTIASGQYGDAQKWRRIYEANRDLIDDPNLIYAGQQLRIPE